MAADSPPDSNELHPGLAVKGPGGLPFNLCPAIGTLQVAVFCNLWLEEAIEVQNVTRHAGREMRW